MKYKYSLLPQNYLAEEILLGIVFIYPQIFYNINNSIRIEYFFLENNKIIYTYIINVYKKNKLNLNNLLYALSSENILYKIGGIDHILDLMKQSQIFITSFFDVNLYIQEIIKLIQYSYIKRIMIQYGHNIIRLAYIPKISHHKIYNKASYYLNKSEEKISIRFKYTFKSLISDFLLKINDKHIQNYTKKDPKSNFLVKSGFTELDNIITSIPKGDLLVVAGRPSTGKTSFVINLAYNVVFCNKSATICIFSLEMSTKQILEKFIAISSKVPIKNIKIKNLNNNQWKKIIQSCYELINMNVYIDDQANMSIDYIEYTTRLLKKENKEFNLIIIDYLQLIQIDLFYKISRQQELSYITRKLKLLAQYLKIPIIILSQLNRNIESRTSKIPILSDLKESGCMEENEKIQIDNNNVQLLSLKSNKTVLHTEKNTENKLNTNQNNVKIKIIVLLENLFLYNTKKLRNLSLTDNHKYTRSYLWIKNNLTLDNYYCNAYLKKCKKKRLYNKPIKNIFFSKKSKSYDLYTETYCNFICKKILLHNSIEQDADIVMMLYKDNESNKQKIAEKYTILDFTLSKNRNGSTGSFQLFFFPDTTLFKNIEKEKTITTYK
uniref:DNA 5'-3' helicase n=1 Tax=Platysiphonia delicata TaxID=2006979 RepID=A0A1Z1M0N6_9FLOR|nr:Replication helicase subunit [Platysiphonia delicata]ARW59668.1 Replication helicase subunit [Platysiphonia delicata]